MITRWAPSERLLSFDRFNKMMEEFFGPTDETRTTFIPSVDIKETDKKIEFYCELPGVNQENVDVELVNDRLTIRGRREFDREEKKEEFIAIERAYGSFQRTFTLDSAIKADEITASFKDGILTVTVPKAATVSPKKVPIDKGK